MFIVFVRTVILYSIVILVVRLMGKKQISELQPYELVITIMVSDLSSLPMQDTRLPLLLCIVPIVTLLMIKIIISELQMRFDFFRCILDGTPCILIKHGKFHLKNMKKERYTVDNVLEELRESGYLDVSEIDYAILENNGNISFFPKADITPITKKDLNIIDDDKILPKILYIDDRIIHRSLHEIGKDEIWLKSELKKLNSPPIDELFLVMFNSDKTLFFQSKKFYDEGNDIH